VGPRVKALLQRPKVDFEDEDGVEQVDELREVARPTTEERGRLTPVGDPCTDFLDVPDVVLVPEAFHRFTRFGISPVRQFAITMDGVVAAALQLVTDGRLASAGKA